MKAIELWDLSGQAFLTLGQVLGALPSRASSASWEVSDFIYPNGQEYFQVGYDGDDGIADLANTDKRVDGSELARLAKTSSQIIWGTFRGYDSARVREAWIALHAVDSTFWRCETEDIPARQALMKSFKDVRLKEF